MSRRALHLIVLVLLVAGAFGLSSPDADSAPKQTSPAILTVEVTGPGTVTGDGISCPGDCTETYFSGMQVTLTATPGAGATFSGWSGDCSGSTSMCSLVLTGNKTVRATFQAPTQRLNVDVVGSGTVTGPGINCPGDCSEDVATNSTVTLNASAAAGFGFGGWGFDCTPAGGSPSCTLTMNSSKLARATFTQGPTGQTLTVAVTGSGTVTGPGINCPTDCTESYPPGTSVALNASPASGFAFGGWGGDCASAGTAAGCTLAMTGNRSASATFAQAAPRIGETGQQPPPPILPPRRPSVLANIVGNGTITVSLTGRGSRSLNQAARPKIACGVASFRCYAQFEQGQTVTATAKPARGYVFQRWSGKCKGTKKTCKLPLSSAGATVGATFARPKGTAAVAVTMRTPRFTVRWSESLGRGQLVVSGRVSSAANLRIHLRRPAGGSLISRRVSVPGGLFSVQLNLAPGRLARGARLFPGGFVVSLVGRGRGVALPLQVRTVALAAPTEGVVRTAFASASELGSPAVSLPAGSKEAWARFRFEVQPRAGQTLTVRWYFPDGRLLGTAPKSNRPEVTSSIRSEAALPTGAWRAELVAGNRIVQRLSVRVG